MCDCLGLWKTKFAEKVHIIVMLAVVIFCKFEQSSEYYPTGRTGKLDVEISEGASNVLQSVTRARYTVSAGQSNHPYRRMQ